MDEVFDNNNVELSELEITCFNGLKFSKFQLAANFFFEHTFHGWFAGESITYLIPPLFRCKSEGYIITGDIDGGVVGNIRGDENEYHLYLAFQNLKTKPQIAFHSFSLRQRLKTYNKLMLPYYRHQRNPYEVHAKAVLRHLDNRTHREDAECDFMVFDKEYGVFLFEVKSSISARSDAKRQLTIDKGFVKVLIENGLSEAGFTNVSSLSETIPVHTFTVFPNIDRGLYCEPDEIYADDIRNFQIWWDGHVQMCNTSHSHDHSSLSQIMTIVAARFVSMASASPVTINEAIANLGETLDTQAFGKTLKKFRFLFLTPFQDSALHHSSEKMIISGPPGSGKSLVLRFKCLEVAKAKSNNLKAKGFKKILVICGYKAIGLKSIYKTFLCEHLGDIYHDIVDVYTKEELDTYYEDVFVLFDCESVLQKMYCDIFVDEIQSVFESMVKLFPKCVSQIPEFIDGLAGLFHFVWFSVDPSQCNCVDIFPLHYKETVWTLSHLPYTLRNTEHIAKEVCEFTKGRSCVAPGHRIKGTSTQWLDVKLSEEIKNHTILLQTIQQLVKHEDRHTLKILNEQQDTVILSPGTITYNDILIYWKVKKCEKITNLLNVFSDHGIPFHLLSPLYNPRANNITVSCDVGEILSMEFRVVIVMFVDAGKEYEDEDFVIPVSRAMCHLIVFRNVDLHHPP